LRATPFSWLPTTAWMQEVEQRMDAVAEGTRMGAGGDVSPRDSSYLKLDAF